MLEFNSGHQRAYSQSFLKRTISTVLLIGQLAFPSAFFSGSTNINIAYAEKAVTAVNNEQNNDAIEIQSDTLETEIRKQSGYLTLTKRVLEGVKQFTLSFNSDYSEIVLMPNIESLTIENISQSGSDFKSLYALRNIETLYISNCDISDWSFLNNYSNLKNIVIKGSKISSFTSIHDFKNLKNLDFKNCDFTGMNFSDINSDVVESISLDGCIGIDNFEFLNYYSNAKELSLKQMTLSKIGNVKASDIERLELENLKLESLNGIKQFISLSNLTIKNCYSLVDANEIMECHNLKRLKTYYDDTNCFPWINNQELADFVLSFGSLSNDRITTMVEESLKNNTNENQQTIISFRDKTMEGILQDKYGTLTKAKLSSVINLRLSQIDKISLEDLNNLINLQKLDLSYINYVARCVSLMNLKFLREITLVNCMMDDYSFLSGVRLPNGYLWIEDTNINSDDIRYLNGLEVQRMFIHNANNLDFSAVISLPRIKELELTNTGLTEIAFVSNFKTLESLDISSNNITDLRPLISLKNLINLNISNNRNLVSFPFLHLLSNLQSFYSENSQLWLTPDALSFLNSHNIVTNLSSKDLEVKKRMIMLSGQIIPDKSIPDEEKIGKIVLCVLNNLKYSHTSQMGTLAYNTDSLQSFLDGDGVCDNYAAAVNTLCTLNGINSTYIEGYGINDETIEYGYIKISPKNRHAWNLVQDGDQYYYLDTTWMDKADKVFDIGDLNSNKYYMVGSDYILKNHYPTGLSVVNISPTSRKTQHPFYQRENLSLDEEEIKHSY